jgi:membrane-associated phospholipid phosphatase
MPDSRDRRPAVVGWFAALAAACALATAIAFLVAIRTAGGQRLDDAARGRLSPFREPRAYSATESLLETISVSSLALFGLGIMAVAIVRGRPRLALGAGAVVVGANLTTQVLKSGLDRPDLVNGLGPSPGAFPSGHVTVAMSLAMALVLVAPPALRWVAAVAGCGYAAVVGVAVLALDWHRPSEVIAGDLVCVGWAAAVAGVLVEVRGTRELGAGGPSVANRVGAVTAVLVGVMFVLVVGITLERRLNVIEFVGDGTAFAAAAVTCAAACALLGIVMTVLLQRAARAPDG